MRILASDVGGTHARFGVFDLDGSGRQPLFRRTYASRDFSRLADAAGRFLQELEGADAGPAPDRACFAIAGPVVNGAVEASNLPWDIRAEEVKSRLGLSDVRLINDFLAIGYGVPWLRAEECAELQAGDPGRGGANGASGAIGAIGVIGPGTGLGYALLLPRDGGYEVHPSEAGHADFAPRDELQAALLAHLRGRFGRVSRERVVSGPGLLNIYRFLVDSGREPEDPVVRAALSSGDGGGPAAISKRALSGAHPASERALDVFVAALGAMAGDLALALKATGGIYLAGGINPEILPRLRDGVFLEAFRSKGRLSEIVERAPVRVILDEDVGLLGAAAAGSPGAAGA